MSVIPMSISQITLAVYPFTAVTLPLLEMVIPCVAIMHPMNCRIRNEAVHPESGLCNFSECECLAHVNTCKNR